MPYPAPSYDDQNVFAKILRGEMPCHRVYETADVLSFMDIMPRAPGHALVIPKAPVRGLLDAPGETLGILYQAVQIVGRASRDAFNADGLTIQQFNEAAGGQIVFHMHVHVLPRHDGVKLDPPGTMADPDVLAGNAEKLRTALTANGVDLGFSV